jgi:hypothetical protein
MSELRLTYPFTVSPEETETKRYDVIHLSAKNLWKGPDSIDVIIQKTFEIARQTNAHTLSLKICKFGSLNGDSKVLTFPPWGIIDSSGIATPGIFGSAENSLGVSHTSRSLTASQYNLKNTKNT